MDLSRVYKSDNEKSKSKMKIYILTEFSKRMTKNISELLYLYMCIILADEQVKKNYDEI
jgi:hypothetical protein